MPGNGGQLHVRPGEADAGPGRVRPDDVEAGRALRELVPRSAHAELPADPAGRDPLALTEHQNRSRLPELVALRTARMAESPLAYLRGTAAVMAQDLRSTPLVGVTVQLCGDAHVANFGLYASPERALLFDVDDFDETAPGPWEWDLKRLATSAVLAARQMGASGAERAAACAAAQSYRLHIARYGAAGALSVWYDKVDADAAVRTVGGRVRADVLAARRHTAQAALPRLTELAPNGARRIADHPPVVSHDLVDAHRDLLTGLVEGYVESLDPAARVLVERFTVSDFALKAVGVGSVGTRCFVALLVGDDAEPLLLQVKEAGASAVGAVAPVGPVRADAGGVSTSPWDVEPPRAGPDEGGRVVEGQHLMQAATDLFLGSTAAGGTSYYVRQLRDMKGSIDWAELRPQALLEYTGLCGWALARAHARSAGPATAARIAGYLGRGTVFDDSVARFAIAYADRTEADHRALVAAIGAGRFAVT
ncbi:MAG TPA: DUF2252 domain-containing protein [Acidimicrobiales bacterium]|nr:DUF2252 domain-containing protein [Acidimicrobiales bacterium]